MREILFKGKRLDNGEWVEGLLFKYRGEFCIALYSIDGDDYGLFPTCYAEVDPTTIDQFTGLRDKNDEKAFSRDVTEDNTGRKWSIFACPGGFGICRTTEWIRNGHELHNGLSETQNAEWFTQNHSIIGNIHDNPELLEGAG